jgi:hypothetical protein
MDALWCFLIVMVSVGIVSLLVTPANRRQVIVSEMVDRWARDNGPTIVNLKTLTGNGPYSIFTKSHCQFVSRVENRQRVRYSHG